MRTIVGLGNPGLEYEKTRHNAGFMFLDKFRDFLGWGGYHNISDWEVNENLDAQVCLAKGGVGSEILLVKPMTFMNVSGRCARKVVEMYKINIGKDFILVHDDLDIEFAKFKIQTAVAPKVHKGVQSVEGALQDKNFYRVRIGVDGREGDREMAGDEYVLLRMGKNELAMLDETFTDAAKSLRKIANI